MILNESVITLLSLPQCFSWYTDYPAILGHALWRVTCSPKHKRITDIYIYVYKYWFSFKKMHLKMLAYKWWPFWSSFNVLTYWGRATHICANKLTTIGSVNGFSPGRRQAIIWSSAGILLIRPLEEISVKSLSKFIYFHSIKCIWKCRQEIVVAILFRPQCVKYDYFHWVKNISSIKLGY